MTILLYAVPQIHKSLLNQLAILFPEELEFNSKNNSFRIKSSQLKFSRYDGFIGISIEKDTDIRIDQNNITDFWIS